MNITAIREKLRSPVEFREEQHEYWLNGRRLRAVSSIVKSFTPSFDTDYWSKKIANRERKTQEQILSEWLAKAKKACAEGKEFHSHAELRMTGSGSLSTSPKAKAFDRWWVACGENFTPVSCEQILHDERLEIAGTTDLILYSRKTRKLHVADWKTNGKFETTNKYGDMLLPPFNDLPSCALNSYSIQVGIYKIMAEAITGEKFGDSWIMHIGSSVTAHRALNLQHRIKWVMEKHNERAVRKET